MLDVQYLGHRLLERGFRDWFLFMFNVVEGTEFILEPLHDDLFSVYQDVLDGKKLRQVINVPPRTAKTTAAIYLIAYAYTKNLKCNFIYTSYSQELLQDNSRRLQNILENEKYKAMYPIQSSSALIEDVTDEPIEEFWANYLRGNKNEGKNIYTSKKITTASGGITLFSAIGKVLTGFGAGTRNSSQDEFEGCLIIDDPQKPVDARSPLMQKKTHQYFTETLLSRLNNSQVPILLIQQRLNVNDLSAYVEKEFDFDVLNKPLIDDNGVCQLPMQYTESRIEELKKNEYLFNSQYQQRPMIDGGNMIKSNWIRLMSEDIVERINFDFTFIAADTAAKAKAKNDFTTYGVWSFYNNTLYLREYFRGKVTSKAREDIARSLYSKYNTYPFYGMHIEAKSSGIDLFQRMAEGDLSINLPPLMVVEVEVPNDKVTRVINSEHYLQTFGIVVSSRCDFKTYHDELIFFPDAPNDDLVDLTTMAVKIAYSEKRLDFKKINARFDNSSGNVYEDKNMYRTTLRGRKR